MCLRSEQIDKMIAQNAISNLGYSWYQVFSTYLLVWKFLLSTCNIVIWQSHLYPPKSKVLWTKDGDDIRAQTTTYPSPVVRW